MATKKQATKKKAATKTAAKSGATSATKPNADYRAKVRMYRQGLGDCFLLTFPDPNGNPAYTRKGYELIQKLRLNDVGVVPGKSTIQRFVVGYVIGLSMSAIQALTVFGFGHLQLTIVPNITAQQIILPLSLYLFVACREELVFRSYSLRSLDYSFSSAVALLSITVIFVLEHVVAGMTWKMAAIGSGLGGILFGLSALKTKGLALPLGLHGAWNFGQWMVGFKNKAGVWTAVVEKGYERETENVSLVAFSLVMLLAITGIVLFYKRKGMEENKAAANMTFPKPRLDGKDSTT